VHDERVWDHDVADIEGFIDLASLRTALSSVESKRARAGGY
jgi:hypothetical protein